MSKFGGVIGKHFEKLIFLNCVILLTILFRHNVLYSLDGGGRYASAKDLFEVGLHGFNDHFFLGNIQNLFYPPLQDFLLGLLIKFNEVVCRGFFSDRFVFSLYIFLIFTFYIYALYCICRFFTSKFAKLFVIFFTSWTLYFNLYFFDVFLGHGLNFYKKPFVIYFQGLSFQDIYTVGLTNQFLCAGFLILGILALARNDRNKTIFYITMSILSHFIFGLVIVLICVVKKLFEKDYKNLVLIGSVTLGLTAFFLIPLLAYRSQMINVPSMPIRSGFWLTAVTFLFLFLKKDTFSYKLGFCAFTLVGFIALAKLVEKYYLFTPNFHFYRLLQPSLLLLILSLGFAFNENTKVIRKTLLAVIFTSVWLVNFGGHYWAPDIFSVYEPHLEKVEVPEKSDFANGRSYVFSIERPIDFTIDLNLYLQGERNYFTKGLYWESARANQMVSTPHFTLMQGPSVLDVKVTHDISGESCPVVACIFNSMLNYSNSYEVFMPPKEFLGQSFTGFNLSRDRFSTCYSEILRPLKATSGKILYKNYQFDRYVNANTSVVRPYSESLAGNSDEMLKSCLANPMDDGRVKNDKMPGLVRNHSGSYHLNLPEQESKWLVSLQYFEGFKYDTESAKGIDAIPSKLGILIESKGSTNLYYQRTKLMIASYVVSILSYLGVIIWYLVNRRRRNRLGIERDSLH
jgi:hypothetical protein